MSKTNFVALLVYNQVSFSLFSFLRLSDAKNPLKPSSKLVGMESNNERSSFHQQKEVFIYDSDDESSGKQLGTFETEQLINAVTKITDLLRKCWGVAGAGIISSNLARQMGGLTSNFNPTVPGVAVYGIFAFVGIDNFQRHLYALKGDIMILINDIAAVLHEEVGDSRGGAEQ